MSVPRVEFDLTADDYITAVPLAVIREPLIYAMTAKSRRAAGLILFVGYLLAFAVGVIVVTFSADALPTGVAILSVATILAMLVRQTEAKLLKLMRGNVRLAFRVDPSYVNNLGRRVYELHPTHLNFAAAHHGATVAWRAVAGTFRTADQLVVTAPGPVHHVIPRSAFASDAEFDSFADELERLTAAAGGTVGSPAPLGG